MVGRLYIFPFKIRFQFLGPRIRHHFSEIWSLSEDFFFHILDRRGSTALCGCAGEYSYRRWRYVHGEAWTKQQRCFVVFLEVLQVQPKIRGNEKCVVCFTGPRFFNSKAYGSNWNHNTGYNWSRLHYNKTKSPMFVHKALKTVENLAFPMP